MMKTNKILFALFLILPVIAMALEEPAFTLLEERDDYEVRRYSPYVIAEVTVTGDFKDTGNAAFRILADYIFGNNTGNTKMEMTVPVETRDGDAGTKMEMTAPVLSTEESGDSYRYAFVIERKYTLENVPKPVDERISLRETQARTTASRRYSGRWTRSNYDTNRLALLDALARDGVRVISEPYFARYNSPFTPWFLRRNEVLVDIDPDSL